MTLTLTHLVVIFGVAITLVTVVLILQQRRTPQSTAAWLLFIFLVPYIAIPLFLGLGFRKQGSRFTPIRFAEPSDASTDVNQLDQFFQKYGLPPATSGNTADLIADGPAAWETVLAQIRAAKDTLDITFYLIADDPIGQAFVEELTKKAKEGLRVRLIIDRLGGFKRPSKALKAFTDAGGELRNFSPLLNLPNKGHLNLRNHRKMIIADGSQVISGGRNIGQEYLAAEQTPNLWSDLTLLLSGPIVQTFFDVFNSDWAATGSTYDAAAVAAQTNGNGVAQLVPSGPDMAEDPLHDGIVSAIYAAKTRVWIATPYFLPTEHLEHALRVAAKRDVDVRILVPRKSNQRIADFARGAYLRNLDALGCRILLYRPGMMHAKAGLIDEVGWVGSANFDIRSMLLNFESALFMYDTKSVKDLENWFIGAEAQCDEGALPTNLLRRVAEGVFRLGAPVL